ncbi:MAG: hypothetical protein IJN87_02540 [Firmicutes bacterium]|nr:hypothetical protein [Bacillota bacterium]
MECGKLTAKLRDAVPVCFMVDGKEVKRFKNIEIPDEIKQLPFIDFKFDVPAIGAITFKLMFEAGVLPEVWPEARQRKQRGSMTVGHSLNIAPETAALMAASVRLGGYADAETVAAMKAEKTAETTVATEITGQSVPEKIAYNVTGDRRKALVAEIANYTGEKAIYQNAPSFAYHIGPYAVDKNGMLTGPIDHNLIHWLASEGFTVTE